MIIFLVKYLCQNIYIALLPNALRGLPCNMLKDPWCVNDYWISKKTKQIKCANTKPTSLIEPKARKCCSPKINSKTCGDLKARNM